MSGFVFKELLINLIINSVLMVFVKLLAPNGKTKGLVLKVSGLYFIYSILSLLLGVVKFL